MTVTHIYRFHEKSYKCKTGCGLTLRDVYKKGHRAFFLLRSVDKQIDILCTDCLDHPSVQLKVLAATEL